MKKAQKGITLIEVIIAIAIFAMISFVLISSIISMKRVVIRQEEYVRLEMVCYDIDAYYRKYKNNWDEKYFGDKTTNYIGYLTSDYEPATDENAAKYKIIFKDNEILSISSIDGEIVYVENVRLPIDKEDNP